MGRTIDNKIKNYIKDLLEGSGAKKKDIAKLAILADKYYQDNKLALDLAKSPFVLRKNLMSTFILFMVQFETVCIKAYKLSGSGSTSDDIIHLYSSVGRNSLDQENQLSIKSN